MVAVTAVAALALALLVAAGGSAAAPTPRPIHDLPNSIAFFDATHGVMGTERTIQTTRDSGRTWTVRFRGRGPFTLVEERWGDEVWATGRRLYLHSADQGMTWREQTRPPVSGAAFGAPLLGWDVKPVWPPSDGEVPWLSETRDGGRSWRRVGRVCHWRGIDFDFAGLAHVSPSRAWIVCVSQPGAGMQPKAIFETRNAGRSWTLRACACFRPHGRGALSWSGYPHAIEFTPRGDGVLIQIRGYPITVTHDGGRNWRYWVGEPEVDMRLDASIVSARRIYALTGSLSERARLSFTTNGGRTWRVVRRWSG